MELVIKNHFSYNICKMIYKKYIIYTSFHNIVLWDDFGPKCPRQEDANVKDLTNEQDQENEEHEEVATARVQHFGGNTDSFADIEAGTRNTISSEEYSGKDEVRSSSNSQLTVERPYQSNIVEGWEDAKLNYNKYAKNVGFLIKVQYL
jgi:hypothetical protein